VSLWTIKNNSTLGTFDENRFITLDLPLSNFESLTTLIAGNLPSGLRLENNKIIGTPNEVARPTTSKFVIRAKLNDHIEDRTFYLLIEGDDPPEWITSSGKLPVGPNNVLFVLDNTIIDYQLLASDPDLPAGDTLKYYISKGQLPGGLELTEDGRIFGIIDPLLSLNFNVISGGYDVNQLDSLPYDFAFDIEPGSRIPKKLNRNFEFEVTVTDNVSAVKRMFSIFVVGDDFARADNTIMKAANGIFTADFTFLRTPLWLTPSDLGTRRANNYLTIYLDAFDANTLQGDLRYVLEPINNDNTPSEVPPGLILDSKTGNLAGIVSYQPNAARTYKFTVNAIRFSNEDQVLTTFRNLFEDVLSGSTVLRLAKTSAFESEILPELLGRSITINNEDYNVIDVSTNNIEFDTITLSRGISSISDINSLNLFRSVSGGSNSFFVNQLNETDRQFYIGKELVYNVNEIYKIQDIFPYIRYTISSTTPILLKNKTDSIDIENDLGEILSLPFRPAEIVAERDQNDDVILLTIIIPSTSQSRSVPYIRSLFENSESFIISRTNDLDRVEINTSLLRFLPAGLDINIGAVKGTGFNKTFSIQQEIFLEKKKTFTIRLLGNVDSEIQWITPKDLGSLNANRISTLFVKAISTVEDTNIRYTLTDGRLPFGLNLTKDGEIIGKVPVNGTLKNPGLTFFDNGSTTFDNNTTTIDRQFKFTILAEDRFNFSGIEREFSLTIFDKDRLEYSNFFARPFLKKDQRNKYQSFFNDGNIFDVKKVYRLADPNFGLQKNPKILMYAGVERRSTSEFMTAISKNHKKRNFYLGDVKTAVAKIPGTQTILYEIVYVEVIDRSKPFTGETRSSFYTQSKNKITVDSTKIEQPNAYNINNKESFRFRPQTNVITSDTSLIKVDQKNDVLRYITNIDNMRAQIRDLIVDSRRVVTNGDFLPLWMRTPQENSLSELGFVLALPLVYTKPGESKTMKENIDNSGFDFKDLDFEIDRYIVDSTVDLDQDQYLLFANYQFNV
jgi:hypothetical protein